MNNTFDWNRFCKVVYKDWRNLWPMFGTTMLIITLLPLALWLLLLVLDTNGSSEISANVRLVIVFSLPILVSIMTPSRLYRTMNLRGEGIYFAMLPASKLEKFVSMLLYSLIICPLLSLVGGVVLDTLLWLLPFGSYYDSIFTASLPEVYTELLDGDFPSSALTLFTLASIIGNVATSLLFLFTATFFKRHKVLLTILWLWLITFVLSLIGMPLMIHFFNELDFEELIESIVDNGVDEVAIMNWMGGISLFFSTAIAVLFGWLGWHRLKKMPY